MPGGDEDKRAAATLVVSLSSYIITAAVAVIGAQAVIVNFVLDKENLSCVFVVTSLIASILLALSVVYGGRGCWQIISNGWGGDWRYKTTGGLLNLGFFNLQAVTVLLGAILVVISAFAGAR